MPGEPVLDITAVIVINNHYHHRALALEEVMRTTLARVSTAGARAMTLEAHPAGQKYNNKNSSLIKYGKN